MISSFSDLLNMTAELEHPHRLLLLFAQTESVSNKKKKKSKEQRGLITPVMCVDKLPDEIASFAALVAEADDINTDWNFILIAGLGGQDGKPPTSEDADPYLNQMVNGLASGEDLSRYTIFDREENPIIMQ